MPGRASSGISGALDASAQVVLAAGPVSPRQCTKHSIPPGKGAASLSLGYKQRPPVQQKAAVQQQLKKASEPRQACREGLGELLVDAAHLRRAETFCASTVPQPKRLCSAFQKLACMRASNRGCRGGITCCTFAMPRASCCTQAGMVHPTHLVQGS